MRKLTPAVLEAQEILKLLSTFEAPFRVMVLLNASTGLRRSELFALKWADVDFCNLTIEIGAQSTREALAVMSDLTSWY